MYITYSRMSDILKRFLNEPMLQKKLYFFYRPARPIFYYIICRLEPRPGGLVKGTLTTRPPHLHLPIYFQFSFQFKKKIWNSKCNIFSLRDPCTSGKNKKIIFLKSPLFFLSFSFPSDCLSFVSSFFQSYFLVFFFNFFLILTYYLSLFSSFISFSLPKTPKKQHYISVVCIGQVCTEHTNSSFQIVTFSPTVYQQSHQFGLDSLPLAIADFVYLYTHRQM